MSTTDLFQIKVFDSLFNIKGTEWKTLEAADFPFTDYSFLSALETAGCLGPHVGWSPIYITVWEKEQLQGALILFAKDNSYGEFIFDFGWAEGAQRAGISYYPKLISAVPFTPATGSKILLRMELDRAKCEQVESTLMRASVSVLQKNGGQFFAFFICAASANSLTRKK